MRHTTNEDEVKELAALHALGALTPHEAHAFESHLIEGCEECEAEAQAFAEVVAQLGFEAIELEPPAGTREQLLQRLAAESQPQQPPSTLPSNVPSQFLIVRANEGEWREVAPGAFFKQLFADRQRETVTWMVKMEPGSRLPKHHHPGVEESIVLSGDCWVNGELFNPGDYRCALLGSVDEEVSTLGGTMLLLITPMNAGLMA